MTSRVQTPSPGRRLLGSLLLLWAAVAAAPAHADASIFERALAAPGRSDLDKARDARDKPAEVLAFAGLGPGMRVADIFGGGGYYSEILARVVGPKGRVLLVNDPAYAKYAEQGLAARFKDGRLSEVERRVVPNEDLGLGKSQLDAALFVMSYHDLYYEDKDEFPRIDAAQLLGQVHAALKRGGLLLIVDHAAVGGSGKAPAQTLHRIDEQFAIRDIESAGFRLLKSYDGLRNPADDRSKAVFDPAIRGRTDRFVHLYRRL
jgi:predicted methyltransferase